MQTNNQNIWTLFLILSVIILAILSTATPSPALKALFLVFGAVWIFLYFYKDLLKNKKKQKVITYITGIVTIVILTTSIVDTGSFTAYGKKVQSFFLTKSDDNSAFIELRDEILDIDAAVSQINDELKRSSEAWEKYHFFSSKYDPGEVEKIVDLINENLESNKDSSDFTNMKTDAHAVELFYKLFISSEPYQYINFIRALESVGIDCEAMSVNEYKLAVWDVERLFALYAMRRDRLADAANGVYYTEAQNLYYNTYKIKADEHSDIFDYGSWRRYFSLNDDGTISAEYIIEKLDDQILQYYKKFHMNFQ